MLDKANIEVAIATPFRVATISAIAAPVTIAVTFAILNLLGKL